MDAVKIPPDTQQIRETPEAEFKRLAREPGFRSAAEWLQWVVADAAPSDGKPRPDDEDLWRYEASGIRTIQFIAERLSHHWRTQGPDAILETLQVIERAEARARALDSAPAMPKRDGPVSPDGFRHAGREVYGLAPAGFQILEALYGSATRVLAETDARFKCESTAIREHASSINKSFKKQGIQAHLHRKDGRIELRFGR